MSAHDHPEYVPGCYRCDLSRDEVTAGGRPSEQCPGDCADDCAKCGSPEPPLWCDDCRTYAAQEVAR